jgi:hypothetical protein
MRIVEALQTTPNFLLGYDMSPYRIHVIVPKIVGILKNNYRQLTMAEKEEIMAALIGIDLNRSPNRRA